MLLLTQVIHPFLGGEALDDVLNCKDDHPNNGEGGIPYLKKAAEHYDTHGSCHHLHNAEERSHIGELDRAPFEPALGVVVVDISRSCDKNKNPKASTSVSMLPRYGSEDERVIKHFPAPCLSMVGKARGTELMTLLLGHQIAPMD